MYEYMTLATKTHTMDVDAHQQKVSGALFLPATQGWRLVSANTMIRGAQIETLTFWEREVKRTEADGS